MIEVLKLRINDAIEECEKHLVRIQESFARINNKFPLTIDAYRNLSSDDVMAIDQFIYRYTKLQDKIGSSLIKNICIYLEGDDYTRTFIDNLNILEKYGILNSMAEWDELREIRNSLTHEYTNNAEQQVDMLNNLVQYKELLITIFQKLKIVIK